MDYISAQQAGARLGITTGRIYQLARSGELPAHRIGRALLIPEPAVEERAQVRPAGGARRQGEVEDR